MITVDTVISVRAIWFFVVVGLTAFIIGFMVRDLEFLIDEIVFILRRRRMNRK